MQFVNRNCTAAVRFKVHKKYNFEKFHINIEGFFNERGVFRKQLHKAHPKIFIILIKLIFQNNFLNKFCGIFPIFFGGVATFAVEVWSWKLFQI